MSGGESPGGPRKRFLAKTRLIDKVLSLFVIKTGEMTLIHSISVKFQLFQRFSTQKQLVLSVPPENPQFLEISVRTAGILLKVIEFTSFHTF